MGDEPADSEDRDDTNRKAEGEQDEPPIINADKEKSVVWRSHGEFLADCFVDHHAGGSLLDDSADNPARDC